MCYSKMLVGLPIYLGAQLRGASGTAAPGNRVERAENLAPK
jgi:hypothetical protein